MEPFIPAKFNLPLNWTVDLLLPVALKAMHNINEVIISEEDKAMLRSLRKERLLFFTNHPTTIEPPITFYISNIIGSRFKFMASRQVFEWMYGIAGKVISNLGAFSVIAGIPDRESLKAARAFLAEKEGKLVLFPEGEPTSGENDNLMPFQPGLAQLGFWALEDARKKDPKADIVVLPGFMKYVIDASEKEIMKDLNESMRPLEKKYKIDPGRHNMLKRFLDLGKAMLVEAEAEYNIKDAEHHDFDYRIGRVRHAMLDNVAERLGLRNYNKNGDAIRKLRQLFAVVEMVTIKYDDPNLPKMTDDELKWAMRECVKAFDFIVIKRDYLESNPTPERFYEWLTRIESYVYGKTPRALGGEPSHLPRKAYITFSKSFHLSSYYEEYKKTKKTAVDSMIARLRMDMQALLDASRPLTKPIVQPYSRELI